MAAPRMGTTRAAARSLIRIKQCFRNANQDRFGEDNPRFNANRDCYDRHEIFKADFVIACLRIDDSEFTRNCWVRLFKTSAGTPTTSVATPPIPATTPVVAATRAQWLINPFRTHFIYTFLHSRSIHTLKNLPERIRRQQIRLSIYIFADHTHTEAKSIPAHTPFIYNA